MGLRFWHGPGCSRSPRLREKAGIPTARIRGRRLVDGRRRYPATRFGTRPVTYDRDEGKDDVFALLASSTRSSSWGHLKMRQQNAIAAAGKRAFDARAR
jgi:hypothetical protein